ncbi:hypothetical protein LIA77_07555 [Sarocladium implicatum]|nr:hypothetical protein LIA77_07555 [Sarocladium implicatum]
MHALRPNAELHRLALSATTTTAPTNHQPPLKPFVASGHSSSSHHCLLHCPPHLSVITLQVFIPPPWLLYPHYDLPLSLFRLRISCKSGCCRWAMTKVAFHGLLIRAASALCA